MKGEATVKRFGEQRVINATHLPLVSQMSSSNVCLQTEPSGKYCNAERKVCTDHINPCNPTAHAAVGHVI